MTALHANLVARAQHLMSADLSSLWTIDDLAYACNTSASTLKTAFRTQTGEPIASWQRRIHMEAACDMMREFPNRSIASIAADVGYANPSKFSRAFCSYMGTTPSTWKKAHREDVG